MTVKNMQIKPYPLGAHVEGEGIRFSFVSAKKNCGILIYDNSTGKRLEKIPFDAKQKKGNVYYKYITKYRPEEISYQFYEEDKKVPASNAAVFVGKTSYGKVREVKDLRAGFLGDDFDWEGDVNPCIPYENSLVYLLHVRGFTKHSSSKVTHRGTFLGVLEKLPYLREIGVTCVELQPAYEFTELPGKEESEEENPYAAPVEEKLNYWGYKKGYYYAPKAAYGVEDASIEFKKLVREFHKNGMEIVMQFYFPKEVNYAEVTEILRYWVLEYHVDGFHLMGENLPADLLASDPMLADTKLWYYRFSTEDLYGRDECPVYRNLAAYQDDYLYTMRKFLKSDEDMVNAVLKQMRHNPEKMGRIHYMSNYYGMTLADMVSYDRKHNEENGEENRDGNDYNCSWNCGEEGKTRRKKITALRIRQIKNAMCMLMFSQSTPLIFMGDEFGNSQKGNNNPYCQDNLITWLDWRDIEKNKEIHSFWKKLVKIRQKHPVLHQPKEPRIMDYIACGYPDLSYHGVNPWRPQTENYSRCVGMMYCGKYAKINRTEEDCFFYVAMNMHWEEHFFGLPRLPKGLKWKLFLTTDERMKEPVTEGKGEDKSMDIQAWVPSRSIVVFNSVPDQTVKGKKEITYKDSTIF